MSARRPYAAGRCAVPTRLTLELARLTGRTHAELASTYGTTASAVSSWYAYLDAHPGEELVASAYVPDVSEIVDNALRGLAEIQARVRELSKHETIDKLVRAGDFLLRVHTALSSVAAPRETVEPDLDRELADFLRVTESPLDLAALRN